MKEKLKGAWDDVLPFLASLVLALGMAVTGLALLVLVLDLIVNEASSVHQVVGASTLERLLVVGVGAAVFSEAIRRLVPKKERKEWQWLPAVGVAVPVIVALLIGLIVWWSAFRSLLGHRGEAPTSFLGAWLPIVGLCVVAGAIVWLVARKSLELIAGDYDRPVGWVPVAIGLVLVVAIAVLVQAPPKTAETLRPDQQLDAAGVHGRPDHSYEVMIVVNPRDAAGRRLIRAAHDHPEQITQPRTDAVRWNTDYGLAVVGPRPGDYRVLTRPTSDRRILLAKLLALGTPKPSNVAANYDLALPDLLTRQIPLREKTERAVVVVAQHAPPRLAPAAVRTITSLPRVVPGKPLPPGAVTLNLVADRGAKAALRRWDGWTSGSGGVLAIHHGMATALADAEDTQVGAPSQLVQRLAFQHRPAVLLDTSEKERPIDVDAFLAETGGKGNPAHRLCTSGNQQYTGCHGVSTGLELRPDVTSRDGVIQLEANKPKVAPVIPDRIYYHPGLSADRTKLHLDYWIFYSFNDAPNFAGYTCLSGISIPDLSCFDHEGDWEGITVTLRQQGNDFVPDSVTYAGHAWRYRFTWQALKQIGAITPNGHPREWVAQGSHASYPGPCGQAAGGVSCHQINLDIPDGRRDGRKPWVYNSDALCRAEHCVLALPQTRWGGPASWAAFGGHWGMPRCVVGTELCVRSLGPSSPYFQRRYGAPEIASIDDALLPLR